MGKILYTQMYKFFKVAPSFGAFKNDLQDLFKSFTRMKEYQVTRILYID